MPRTVTASARAALQLRHLEHARAGAPDGDAGGAIRAERARAGVLEVKRQVRDRRVRRRPGGAVRTSARLVVPLGRRVRLAGVHAQRERQHVVHELLAPALVERVRLGPEHAEPGARGPRSPSPSASAALSARHACPALMRATVARDASKARPVKFKGGSNVTRLFPVVPVPLTVPTACRRLMSGASEPTTPRTSTMSPRAEWMHAPRPELRVRRARDPAVLRAVAGLPVRAVQHAVAVRRAVAVRVTQRTPAVVHVQRVCQRALAAAIRRRRLERRPLVVFQNVFFSPNPPPMKRATPSAAPGSKWSPVRGAASVRPEVLFRNKPSCKKKKKKKKKSVLRSVT